MRGRLALLAVVALTLLPAAVAAGPVDASGRLSMEAIFMRGEGSASGDGLLEIAPPGDASGLRVGFGQLVEGWIVRYAREGSPTDMLGMGRGGTNETLPGAGGGRVENVRCAAACVVALFNVPGEGCVGAEGPLDGVLAPTRAPRHVQGRQWALVPWGVYNLREGTMEVPMAAGARPWVSGRVGVLVANATFDLVTPEGRRSVDVVSWNETAVDALGAPVLVRTHVRYAVLMLDDARLEAPAGAAFRLSFPDRVDLRLDGTLSTREGSGDVKVSGRPYALEGESLTLEGAMAAHLRSWPPSRYRPAWGIDGDVDGSMRSVVVDGVRVASAEVAPPPAPERPAGAEVLVGMSVVFLGRVSLPLGRLFLPLYSRLRPSDMLANANRRRIYETIQRRPGLGVAEIVAEVGLARFLVRHHLRMLETHGFVVLARWRRRLAYSVVGDRTGQAACGLKDPTRRRVAATLVGRAEGATQKDLAAQLGLSQRLVSYHLARLEDLSLVRAQGRNPRAYVATRALAEALGEEGDATAARGRAAA